MKYPQPDDLYELVLFECLQQIRGSHVMFKVMFHWLWIISKVLSLLWNVHQIISWTIDRQSGKTKPINSLNKIIYSYQQNTAFRCWGVTSCKGSLSLLQYVFTNPPRDFYLKEIYQNIHSNFLDALDNLQIHPASVDDTETIVMSIFEGGNLGHFSQVYWQGKEKFACFATKLTFAK